MFILFGRENAEKTYFLGLCLQLLFEPRLQPAIRRGAIKDLEVLKIRIITNFVCPMQNKHVNFSVDKIYIYLNCGVLCIIILSKVPKNRIIEVLGVVTQVIKFI